MNKTYFAKYNKHLSVDDAIKKINTLRENGSIPIKYNTFAEVKCEHKIIQNILTKGNINEIYDVSFLGIHSVQSSDGIWQCIAFISSTNTLIVYTGGSSEIMYFSMI